MHRAGRDGRAGQQIGLRLLGRVTLHAVVNLGGYLVAILIGTAVTTGMLFLLKKPLGSKVQAFAREAAVA